MSDEATVIAVVDDEQSVRKALERLLRSVGYTVATFGSGSEFLESTHVHASGCLVLDLHMPQMDGLEVQARLAKCAPSVPVVVITGHDSPQSRERAIAQGACAYLRKPIDDRTLLDAIRRALSGGNKATGQ